MCGIQRVFVRKIQFRHDGDGRLALLEIEENRIEDIRVKVLESTAECPLRLSAELASAYRALSTR